MITIKNSQLNNDTIASLNNLLDTNIKASAAFKLMRIVREISNLVEDKLKMEQKILEKYTEKNEDGNPMPVFNEKNEKIEGAVKITDISLFQNEMDNLLNSETQIAHDTLPFEELGLETFKVKDLLKIDFIFNENK